LPESLFTAHDLLSCGQKWLACLTPFFKESERKSCGCQHRLFFSQIEYCYNLIFHRRAALDQLGQRLLDANRTIGQPNKITTIFGRKVTKYYKGKLQTVIEDLDLPNPSQTALSARDADQHLLTFRPFDSRENRIAMDDLPSQDLNFAGPAAPSATPERNLDAGVLETVQQVFGCPDVDRLPGVFANGYERRIALPGTRTEALDVNRLSRPAERFRRVDHRVHQSRRTAGVDVRPLRLALDERGNVEPVSKAIVIEPVPTGDVIPPTHERE